MANGEGLFTRVGAGLAALTSPQAAQTISATRAQRRGAEADRQKLMQSMIVSGVAEGHIPTEDGARALEQLGLPDSAASIRELKIKRPEATKAAQFETIMIDGVPTRVALDPVTGERRTVVGEAPAGTPLIQQQIGAKAAEAGQIERAKQREKAQSETLKGFRDELKASQELAGQSRQLAELSKQFPTGVTAPARLGLAKVLPAAAGVLGVDVTAGENIETISKKLNLKGTELLAGAISEKELELVGGAFANMTKTPEGNFIISRLADSAVENKRRRLSEAQKWIQANGALEFTNDQGQVFEDWWSQELGKTETIIGSHPQFGEVTLDDILTTAKENKWTIEQVINRYGLF